MDSDDLSEAKKLLLAWRSAFEPIFWASYGDDSWEIAQGELAALEIPASNVWINFDDGDGSCLLTPIEFAPEAEQFDYLGLYVTRKPSTFTEIAYLLTDQDEVCPRCESAGEIDGVLCAECNGLGTKWIEIDDPSQTSNDPKVLRENFGHS